MGESLAIRELTPEERVANDLVLRELREHFSEWSEYDSEHELIEFAIYEGCSDAEHCSDVLRRAAPLALGKQLIEREGFMWVMVQRESGWQLALAHTAIAEPIDMAAVTAGKWNREQYDEKPNVVQLVNDSYAALAAAATQHAR
jgi:hypothetical protein